MWTLIRLAAGATLLCSATGCAGMQVQVGPCSKYPCEWSKPVVKGKMGVPQLTETAKAYLCWEPTRQYPVMPAVNCI